MNEKSKSIFISSTFEDLKRHRRKRWQVVEKTTEASICEKDVTGNEQNDTNQEAHDA